MPVLSHWLRLAAMTTAAGVASTIAVASQPLADVTIVDPQGSVVVGARITERCPGRKQRRTRTASGGQAALSADLECELSVRATGFATWHGLTAGIPGDRTITLQVAPVEQHVEVTAPAVRQSWAPLASVELRGDDLRRFGSNAALALKYAKARAGASFREDRVFIDGLPADAVPHVSAIESLSINADPFSVLFTDSDYNVIEVTSAAPDRKWLWTAEVLPPALGLRNPLAPHLHTRQATSHVGIGGPIARTPLTFSLSAMRHRVDEERPLLESSGAPGIGIPSRARGQAVSAGIVGAWRGGVTARLAAHSAQSNSDAVDAGGFVLLEAASSSTNSSRDIRLVVDVQRGGFRHSSAIAYANATSTLRAETDGIGVMVPELTTAGGAAVRALALARRSWTVSSVARTPYWLAGATIAAERTSEDLTPNPFGQLSFGSAAAYEQARRGLATAVWTRMLVPSRLTLRSISAAAFGEREWRLSLRTAVRAGLRFDLQSRDTMAVSPRVSAQTRIGRATVTSSVGLFRQNWSNEVWMQARRFDRARAPRVISDVLLADELDPGDGERLTAAVDGSFTRPLTIMVRQSAEATAGFTRGGLEYTWTEGLRRAGSVRRRTVDGWVDLLESTRRLRRHQVHARLEFVRGAASVVGHYQWVFSHDNTEGPFTFPERQTALLNAEWSRSTGVAPHQAGVVLTLPTMRGVAAGAMFTARSAAPFDIRTGLDLDGTRLFLDRGGQRRNAHRGPSYQSLDAYAQRRVQFPKLKWRGAPLALLPSVTGENLLSARNYLTLGSIQNSRYSGRPIAAGPGRTLRFLVRVTK